ncbi:MAG: arginine deiminase family protein [Gemmatimonadales bacterium]
MTPDIRFRSAIARTPSASYANGLTTSTLGSPDLVLALTQHAAYCALLEQLGVRVTLLPPDDAYPDSTFVEDTGIVTARGAIIARPGAPSRAGEVVAMREALIARFGEAASITAPGTLDGGDICQVGDHFFIGLSARTNAEGARQLATWLAGLGYSSDTIDIHGDATLLHLKSGMTWLGSDNLLVVGALAEHPALLGYRCTVVAPHEGYAANAIRVNDAVVMAAGFPGAVAQVEALGYRVVTLDVSEFAKMDGGLSCLSIRS